MSEYISNVEAPFGLNHGPQITGNYAPIATEQTLQDLPVEGKIPQDLSGVYLRNGPNPRFEPKGSHHYFDGDGMIHSACFSNGKVVYRNRWIRTEGWLKNDAAGEDKLAKRGAISQL